MKQQGTETLDSLMAREADNTLTALADLAINSEQSAAVKGGPAKVSCGTLVLSSANTYQGLTTVSEGVLL